MHSARASSIKESSAGCVVSLAEVQLEQLAAFYARLSDLERVYRLPLREAASDAPRFRGVAQAFRSSVLRACEALLNGSSQAEVQVFRSEFPR